MSFNVQQSVEVIAKRLARGKSRRSILQTLGSVTRHSVGDWTKFWNENLIKIEARAEQLKENPNQPKRDDSVQVLEKRPRKPSKDPAQPESDELGVETRPAKRQKTEESTSIIIQEVTSTSATPVPSTSRDDVSFKLGLQNEKIKTLNNKLREAQVALTNLQVQLNTRDTMLQQKETERREALKQSLHAQDEIDRLASQLDQDAARINDMDKAQRTLKTQLQNLESKVRSQDVRAAHHRRDLQELEQKHKQELSRSDSSKMSRYLARIATLEAALQFNVNDSPARKAYEKAYAMYVAGDILPSVAAYSDALFTSPDAELEITILFRRSEAQVDSGDFDRLRLATKDLDAILARAPNHIDAILLYANIEAQLSQHDAAMTRLQQILDMPALDLEFRLLIRDLRESMVHRVRDEKRAAEQAHIDARVKERRERDASDRNARAAEAREKERAEDAVYETIKDLDDHQLLGLSPSGNTAETIKKAQKLARIKYHPDKCGGSKRAFQQVEEAANRLLNDLNSRPPPSNYYRPYTASSSTGYRYPTSGYGSQYGSNYG